MCEFTYSMLHFCVCIHHNAYVDKQTNSTHVTRDAYMYHTQFLNFAAPSAWANRLALGACDGNACDEADGAGHP